MHVSSKEYASAREEYLLFLKHEASATLIQSSWRMHVALKDCHFESVKLHVVALQAWARQYLLRRRFIAEQAAAIVIQSWWRMSSCKREYGMILEAPHDTFDQEACAVLIQSVYRMRLARRFKARSSTTIQSNWRKWRCMHAYRQVRTAHVEALEKDSAVCAIQSWWKMRRAHQQSQSEQLDCSSGLSCRCECNPLAAATTIQSSWRRWVAIRHLKSLQAAHKEKVESQKRRSSALKVQSLWRMRLARRYFNLARLHVITVQSWWRQHCQRQMPTETTSEDFAKHEASAIVVQSAWRMYSVRDDYKFLREECILIQSWWRQVSQCSRFAEMRRAAIVIQMEWLYKPAWEEYLWIKVNNEIRPDHEENMLWVQAWWYASKIQSVWRMHVAFEDFEFVYGECVYIQAWWRMVSVQRRFCIITRRVTTIGQLSPIVDGDGQSSCVLNDYSSIGTGSDPITQGNSDSDSYDTATTDAWHCAAKIQSVWRMYVACQDFEFVYGECVCIQKWWRMVSARRRYYNTRVATNGEASNVVDDSSTNESRDNSLLDDDSDSSDISVIVEWRCAAKIQSAWRMYVAFQHFDLVYRECVYIQAWWRMVLATHRYGITLTAAAPSRVAEPAIVTRTGLRPFSEHTVASSSEVSFNPVEKREAIFNELFGNEVDDDGSRHEHGMLDIGSEPNPSDTGVERALLAKEKDDGLFRGFGASSHHHNRAYLNGSMHDDTTEGSFNDDDKREAIFNDLFGGADDDDDDLDDVEPVMELVNVTSEQRSMIPEDREKSQPVERSWGWSKLRKNFAVTSKGVELASDGGAVDKKMAVAATITSYWRGRTNKSGNESSVEPAGNHGSGSGQRKNQPTVTSNGSTNISSRVTSVSRTLSDNGESGETSRAEMESTISEPTISKSADVVARKEELSEIEEARLFAASVLLKTEEEEMKKPAARGWFWGNK